MEQVLGFHRLGVLFIRLCYKYLENRGSLGLNREP